MADGLSYTLDATDTIVAVGGKWNEFALQNDGPDIVSEKVIGKKLDQFVHGDETLMFVRTMIMSARVLKRPVVRPYRCDSPSVKRFMEMKVEPKDLGAVDVMHRELRSEPSKNTVRVAGAPMGAVGVFIKRCSICNQVHAKDVWSELDDAIAAERLTLPESQALRVVYGVCPSCLSSMAARTTGFTGFVQKPVP